MACKRCTSVEDMVKNHPKVTQLVRFLEEFHSLNEDIPWTDRARIACAAVHPGLASSSTKKTTEFVAKRRDIMRRHKDLVLRREPTRVQEPAAEVQEVPAEDQEAPAEVHQVKVVTRKRIHADLEICNPEIIIVKRKKH
ncbi:unnamed protein product [Ceutorhynchus assimilis]|uniref:Uncharacterized protein n=1 Tax=Ceutorhynchus assimilis TaxID=467358 RepID=A0A9N9MVE7_9CUCU|nr:unnamed protein product [Ceutorhynchus assimilis]